MCLSNDYDYLVPGFVGNTNIHKITQVKVDCKLSLYLQIQLGIDTEKNYATEYYKINRQHTPISDNQHSKEVEA
jgi:hypothetical protein